VSVNLGKELLFLSGNYGYKPLDNYTINLAGAPTYNGLTQQTLWGMLNANNLQKVVGATISFQNQGNSKLKNIIFKHFNIIFSYFFLFFI
jgi:hypothetical protein